MRFGATALLLLVFTVLVGTACGDDDSADEAGAVIQPTGISPEGSTPSSASDEVGEIALAACKADLKAADFSETAEGLYEKPVVTSSNGLQGGGRQVMDLRFRLITEATPSQADAANGISRRVDAVIDLLYKGRADGEWEEDYQDMQLRLINGGWERYGGTLDGDFDWWDYRTPLVDGCYY